MLKDLPYLRRIHLKRDQVPDFGRYPFNIAAVSGLTALDLHPCVTFLIGENGAGKSTLVEGIAVAAGFNAEGGSRNFNFATRASHSELHEYLQLQWGHARPSDGYFLRSESLYGLATEIERLDEIPGSGSFTSSYGGRTLHSRSHGEAFMAIVEHRLRGAGLYLLDEPEAALSPARQMQALGHIDRLVHARSQFVIATHSPIILAYPHASIYLVSEKGLCPVSYEDTEHFLVTRGFLADPASCMKAIVSNDTPPGLRAAAPPKRHRAR